MRIGVVKEIKQAERRVALTPAGGAAAGRARGLRCWSRPERGVGWSDDAYTVVGAQVLPTLLEVWQQSELLLKVKEPIEPEYPLMHAGLTNFHRARPGATEAIPALGATAIAYETVETATGVCPLLARR